MKEPVICPSSDSILAGDRIYDTIFRTWAIMSFFRQGTSLSLLLENCFLWLLSESDCFLTFWFLFSAPFIQQQSINSGLAYSLTWDDVGSHFAFIHKVDSLSEYLTMWAFSKKKETFHSNRHIEVGEESLLKGPHHRDLLVLLDNVHLLDSKYVE